MCGYPLLLSIAVARHMRLILILSIISIFEWNSKVYSNEKVRNDTVGINEEFIQNVHQRSEYNDPID